MKRILTLFSCFLIPLFSFAAHIVGGEITYECLGAQNGVNQYRFTVKVYRDCFGSGANFDGTGVNAARMHLTLYEGNSQFPYRIIDLNDRPNVTPVPLGIEDNPCIVQPREACVQQGVYVFEESLPISTEPYTLVYQRCCRNGTISNLVAPGATGSTFSVEITTASQQVCNNSPTFKDFPPVVICANEELVYDHSAIDVEGDQLVYSFCSPKDGGDRSNVAPDPDLPPPFDDVRFTGGFTGANPLAGNPQVRIDPNTGEIRGVPNQVGQFVVGICVQEFRNGVLLTELSRDFQFNITECERKVNAFIQGNDAVGAYVYETCNELVIPMINQSTDPNFIDEYLWKFDVFDSTGTQLTYNTRNIIANFPRPGFYTGQMILNPGFDSECTDTADIIVNISEALSAEFETDYDTCVAGPVSFFDQTAQSSIPIADWFWSFGDGNTSTEQEPIHQYTSAGAKDVSLVITDTLGCTDSITKPINWFPVPPLIIIDPSKAEGCPPLDVTFTNLSTPINNDYIINWDFGDSTKGTGISPTHIYEEPGQMTVKVDITSPIGCFTSDEFKKLILVDSPPVAAFNYTPQMALSNFNPKVNFINESKFVNEWEWDFGGNGTSGLPNPEFIFPDTGQQVVRLIGTHFYGCKDTTFQVIDIVPEITYFLPNAFTPNGDSKNEEFRAGGFFRGIRDFEFVIFNRWGELVFRTNDPSTGWNGRKNNAGIESPNGVYVYNIHFTGPRGKMHAYQGNTVLIR